jgi:CheY-like chemotaxis protein
MPRMSGLDVVKKIRSFLVQINKNSDSKILEPDFVIVSAFMMPTFKKFLAANDIHSIYEKPLQHTDLKKILEKSIGKK